MLVCLINHKREVFMKGFAKITLTVALAACLITPAFAQTATAATATGYTCAEDVRYVKSGKYIYNWGARGEEATFLSTYAEDFYTGSYVYSVLSEEAGGSGSSNAPKSDLYKALQTLMDSKQTYETSYNATRKRQSDQHGTGARRGTESTPGPTPKGTIRGTASTIS